MNRHDFHPIFNMVLSPFIMICSILNLGTFSITRFSPSDEVTDQSLMSSATAVIFAFLFYLASGIMLIYIPKLSDYDQLIKFDRPFSINIADANKRQRNDSNDLTSDCEESQEMQVSHQRFDDDELQNEFLTAPDYIEDNDAVNDKNIRRVHFNERTDCIEEACGSKTNKKKSDPQNYKESNAVHDDNKHKDIKSHHEGSDSSTNSSSYHYVVPDESNSSDIYHYKVPKESIENILGSECSTTSERQYNNNPKSVHSGISSITNDFEFNKNRKHQIKQQYANINNIDLSMAHVIEEGALNHNVDTSRQVSSINQSDVINEATVGETIFVIGDTMVI